MKFNNIILITLMLSGSMLHGQESTDVKSAGAFREGQLKNQHSIGSSFFMLGNLLEDSPDYVLLTYGYRPTEVDRFFVEFNTWKYSEPLGTYGNSEEFYPGYVRAFGVGTGYQRFIWKGLFATAQATPFVKLFYNEEKEKIQNGFQLYIQGHLGYRFEFFQKRWYLEPAIALKYWPIDTNYPNDFAAIEKGAPKHIFEPSLNFGFRF